MCFKTLVLFSCSHKVLPPIWDDESSQYKTSCLNVSSVFSCRTVAEEQEQEKKKRGSAALTRGSFQTELTFRSISASDSFGCLPSLMPPPPKDQQYEAGGEVTVNYVKTDYHQLLKKNFIRCCWLKMNITSSYNRLSGVRDSFTFVIAAFLLKGLSAARPWCHWFIISYISSEQK